MRKKTGLSLICCAFLLSGCLSASEIISQQEDQLSAAGFVQRPANTSEREAMLKRLPPNQFVRRVNGDEVTYVYGDPVVCNCLYVGTQQAYGEYIRYVQARRLANEQRTTAMMYSDPAWNWGAWGPWGPRYGFGMGFGW
jgi:hypothetical protein